MLMGYIGISCIHSHQFRSLESEYSELTTNDPYSFRFIHTKPKHPPQAFANSFHDELQIT